MLSRYVKNTEIEGNAQSRSKMQYRPMTAMPTPMNRRKSIMDRSASSRPSIAVNNLRKSAEKFFKKSEKPELSKKNNPESWFKDKRKSKESQISQDF